MEKREIFIKKIKDEIRQERRQEENISADEIINKILKNEIIKARGILLFHSNADTFSDRIQSILGIIDETYASTSQNERVAILSFLSYLCIDLKSFLPEWHLRKVISEKDTESTFKQIMKLVGKLEQDYKEDAQQVIKKFQLDTISRFKAEGLTEETDVYNKVDLLICGSITNFIKNIIQEIGKSNLFKIATARLTGTCDTEIGNDYAAFLQYVIWLGGSFVTTNPVLVKLAWDINPSYWNLAVDRLIKSHYSYEDLKKLLLMPVDKGNKVLEEINSLITMAVVEENCILLRDIFLVTEGNNGYVSLQINPKNHSNGEEMVTEALKLHKKLQEKLGGVPNVVFKLPATAGGKYAAQKLTSQGIGVNITVNFSAFQSLSMGEVLKEGIAPVSYISVMNGRLAFPVRDELKEKGIEGGESAARMAGVEIARKVYRRLYTSDNGKGLCIDKKQVKLLIASLRIYDDWIPDISELWGSPVITIFPDIRRVFDNKNRPFEPNSILNSTPEKILEVLFKSEIFRQAWWLPNDLEDLKPKDELSLQPYDSLRLEQWEPISKTLGQFVSFYDQMIEMVRERIKRIVG